MLLQVDECGGHPYVELKTVSTGKADVWCEFMFYFINTIKK